MGQQVPRMGNIYSKAERTISWLGRKGSSWVWYDLEQVMGLIAESVKLKGVPDKSFDTRLKLLGWTEATKLILGKDIAVDAPNSSPRDSITAGRNIPSTINGAQHLISGPLAHFLIFKILALPYWRRVWVVQEVPLAKKVVLIFGGACLDFEDFHLAYKSYCDYISREFYPRNGALSVVPIEARVAVHENNISFQQILLWGRHCKASKTVDRIYGLLGLLERCGGGIDTLTPVLVRPIDYTRDWREVYWEIVLTHHTPADSSIAYESRYEEASARWLAFLRELGQSFSCPFTEESLKYAVNKRATPLCRNKAHIALLVIDICRQVVMTSIVIQLPYANSQNACSHFWPTKPCARQLWLETRHGSSCEPFDDIQLLLSTLLIETAEIEGMDDIDKYQAAIIGLKMFETERGKGRWSCIRHQSITKGPLGHNIKVSFQCEISTDSSHLSCSEHLGTLSNSPSLGDHQCRTSDRYLVIERTGWRLSFKDLRYVRAETNWTGSLNVEY